MTDYVRIRTSEMGEIPIEDPLLIENFEKKDVDETNEDWQWHRSPGRGGKDVGQDFFVPADHVMVGWEANIESEHNTGGNPPFNVVFEKGRRGILIPRGVQTGIRLEPGGGGGIGGLGDVFKELDPTTITAESLKKFVDSGGAAYTGTFKFFYVNEEIWRQKF